MTKTLSTLLAAAFATALVAAPASAEQNDPQQVTRPTIEAPVAPAQQTSAPVRASSEAIFDRAARDKAGDR